MAKVVGQMLIVHPEPFSSRTLEAHSKQIECCPIPWLHSPELSTSMMCWNWMISPRDSAHIDQKSMLALANDIISIQSNPDLTKVRSAHWQSKLHVPSLIVKAPSFACSSKHQELRPDTTISNCVTTWFDIEQEFTNPNEGRLVYTQIVIVVTWLSVHEFTGQKQKSNNNSNYFHDNCRRELGTIQLLLGMSRSSDKRRPQKRKPAVEANIYSIFCETHV